MAAEDADRERLDKENKIKMAMQVDAACMHDTALIDNCFFSSRAKVVAQAQTVAVEAIEAAISIMTPFSKSSLLGKLGDKKTTSKASLIKGSQKVFGNNNIDSDLNEQTPRDFMASDRNLISQDHKDDLYGVDGAGSDDIDI